MARRLTPPPCRFLAAALSFFWLAAQPAPSPAQFIAFGDSITAGFGMPGVDCDNSLATGRGYSEELSRLLRQAGFPDDAVVSGVCGEITAEGVTRIESVLGRGQVILLMEGTNDLSRGIAPISLETVRTNLQLMAGKALARRVRPVYSSIIPYGPGVIGRFTNNARASSLMSLLEETAEIENTPFANPFDFFESYRGGYEQFYPIDDGYHLTDAGYRVLAEPFLDPTKAAFNQPVAPISPCVASDKVICLNNNRFQVEVVWTTASGTGPGVGQKLTTDTGRFWFFDPANIELMVKLLDGRCLNGHYWVYYGSLTDVSFEMTVTDTVNGRRVKYRNSQGTFASRGDVDSFAAEAPPTCPEN